MLNRLPNLGPPAGMPVIAAAFLGQARMLGTVEVGKIADLVVLGADPVASITAIRQIEVVIRDGRVVWRR